jgi:hypothetical protein
MAPRGGRFRLVAPVGGVAPGRPRWAVRLTRSSTLPAVGPALLALGLSYVVFIQPDGADTVRSCPEVQSRHPTFTQQLSMDPNRAFPFQKPSGICHAVLGRDAQAQVHMVGHRVLFHQLHSTLTAQFASDYSNLPSQPSAEDFLPVLRYNCQVVLAIRPHMGQALPGFTGKSATQFPQRIGRLRIR